MFCFVFSLVWQQIQPQIIFCFFSILIWNDLWLMHLLLCSLCKAIRQDVACPLFIPQVIYVMRNPKDVIVSSYYFHQMARFLDDPGTFDEFVDKFLEGKGQILHLTFFINSLKYTSPLSINLTDWKCQSCLGGWPYTLHFLDMLSFWVLKLCFGRIL